MERIICLVIGYLFGNIFQTGYWYGKFNHIDIREYGSGNAGSNLMLCVHWERKRALSRIFRYF